MDAMRAYELPVFPNKTAFEDYVTKRLLLAIQVDKENLQGGKRSLIPIAAIVIGIGANIFGAMATIGKYSLAAALLHQLLH